MKLGASYNAFDDSVELLRDSIVSIRDNVDYVSVVYQKISNYGQQGKPETLELLKELQDDKLIDDCFLFEPKVGHGSINEVNKRNYGLQTCKNASCTHFMTMDCDEYYKQVEFANAKDIICKEDYDTTICSIQNYFKKPTYQIRPFNKLTVPFITRINDKLSYNKSNKFPTLVDPTRRSIPGKWHLFERDIIEMHHFSYVRSNIRDKLTNSSARGCFKQIDNFITLYDDYKPGDTFWISEPPGKETTVEVENFFNINL